MRQDESNDLLSRADELKEKLHRLIDQASAEEIEKLNEFMTAFLG